MYPRVISCITVNLQFYTKTAIL
uniref:Uncharacterized protein n=1 Tax=Anguilla anguilla TaxID=7936 RepID=A0A0E9P9M1_ANGAN